MAGYKSLKALKLFLSCITTRNEACSSCTGQNLERSALPDKGKTNEHISLCRMFHVILFLRHRRLWV